MSSLPTTKRAKTGGRGNAHDTNENEKLLPHARINVIAQLVDMDGNNAGPQLDLPHDCTSKQLEELLNTLLNNTEEKGEKLPYEFYIKDETLTTDLGDHLAKVNASMEQVLKIVYAPQALFRVRPVTRCSSAIPGHAEAILSVSFSRREALSERVRRYQMRLWNHRRGAENDV